MSHFLELDGQQIPIILKENNRAKRLILRLNPKGDGVIITHPKGCPVHQALSMAENHKVWISNQISRQSDVSQIQEGATLPFKGIDHTIRHLPDARGTVWCEKDIIYVAGKEEFLKRRLRDWIKKQAKEELSRQAHELATFIHKTPKKINVRDTVSRWGSCAHNGNLSFNWRLIMAPPEILTYVVAHEVAHLRHMDHSQNFWDTVAELGVNAKAARGWLKKNGTLLQKIDL